MTTATLLIIAKTWEQPKCPLTDEGLKKMWHIYIYMYINTHMAYTHIWHTYIYIHTQWTISHNKE